MEKVFNLVAALEREGVIKERIGAIAEALEKDEKREAYTEEENQELRELRKELAVLEGKIAANKNIEDVKAREEVKTPGQMLREILQDARQHKDSREITLEAPSTGSTKADIRTSGAINLTIKDLIPTINEGLGLPSTLSIVTGVEGDELYPYGIDDAEFQEVGETASLTDQDLKFAQLKVTAARCGLSILVSNTAIDNAAFDLMGYIQQKFTLALSKYLAKKVYSQAAWDGNKGPFSGLYTAYGASAPVIDVYGKKAYENILNAVAEFVNKGFPADGVVLVMGAKTEALLKATLKKDGVGAGFIIENGKCAGYDYVVTHYINTELDSDKNLVATTDDYLGIGYFNYEAVQQHGKVRMTIDSTSNAVAVINSTALVLNTAWSLTDLSTKVNGGNGNTDASATQAFAIYKIKTTA